jgi:Sulfotransferase family
MSPDRPIFVVSPPRSGTSLLYRSIGDHPQVGYFTHADKKFPEHPRWARFFTRIRVYGDQKRESRALWTRFHPGGDRPLTAADALPEEREWLHWRIERTLALRRASRFAAKLPVFSVRVPWLDALFPSALFLHIRRDWRPVVSSMLVKADKNFGGGVFGVDVPDFEVRAGEPREVTAARNFLAVHTRLTSDARPLADRFHTPWFEDLCADPVATMREVFDFCDLPWIPAMEDTLPGEVRPVSDKWKKTLTPEILERLHAELGDALLPFEHPAHGA